MNDFWFTQLGSFIYLVVLTPTIGIVGAVIGFQFGYWTTAMGIWLYEKLNLMTGD